MAKNILIVDDETEIVELLKVVLQKTPEFSVATAMGGAEAFLKIKRTKFDLIITDFNMPQFSGADLLHMAHLEGINKDTPVVIITGFAQDLESKVANEQNFRVVEKPFDMEEFSVEIRRQLLG